MKRRTIENLIDDLKVKKKDILVKSIPCSEVPLKYATLASLTEKL